MGTADHAFATIARWLAACADQICRLQPPLRDAVRCMQQSHAEAASQAASVPTRYSRSSCNHKACTGAVADIAAGWASGPLPPELALQVFALAADDWCLRCVCRGCARMVEVAAASARLVLDTQA